MAEDRIALVRAYQDANTEIRHLHDEEFHSILERIYGERGLKVNKRRSRMKIKQDRLDAARKLVSEADVS